MTRILRCLPVLLFALGASAVSAGDIDIKLGTEVRVTTSGAPVTGTLAGLTQKAIVLRRNDQQVEFPLAEVEKLEVMNSGRKGHYGEMMLAGAASGGLMGALVGYAGTIDSSGHTSTDGGVITGAAVGAVLGAVGGYAISRYALHRDPHWEEVELRPKIHVGAMPVCGRGLGLTVSVAF